MTYFETNRLSYSATHHGSYNTLYLLTTCINQAKCCEIGTAILEKYFDDSSECPKLIVVKLLTIFCNLLSYKP